MNESSSEWGKCNPKGIVIDGSSFLYSFSKRIEIPWTEGGRYWVLRDTLTDFFKHLKSRGIEVIVVLEGFDHHSSRVEKKEQRIKNKEEKNQSIAKELLTPRSIEDMSMPSLPVLSFRVFMMVMEELSVKFVFAEGEGDLDTVAIANHYDYPVLAKDSDYFMFYIRAGYIPIDRLNFGKRPLNFKVYKLCDFISRVGLKDPQLSRVIPAVLGNDFIKSDLMPVLVQLTRSDWELPNVRKIENFVKFISKNFSCVGDLLLCISKLEREKKKNPTINDKFQTAIEMYGRVPTTSEEVYHLPNTSSCIPDTWPSGVTEGLIKHEDGRLLISAVIEGSYLPRCVIDDPHKPTARLASVGIRQSMYTMMSTLMEEKRVKEIMRNQLKNGGNIEGIKMVEHEVLILSPSPTLPSVLDIEGMSPDEKLSVFCRVLGIDCNILDGFDNQWKLVIAAACYWVKKCEPSEVLVKAIVATFFICFRIQPDAVNPKAEIKKKNGVLEDLSLEHATHPKVERLLSSLQSIDRTSSQWLDALHSFACFQCIYNDTVTLNDLLQGCLDATLFPAFFFDGNFALACACSKAGELTSVFEEIEADSLFSAIYTTLNSQTLLIQAD